MEKDIIIFMPSIEKDGVEKNFLLLVIFYLKNLIKFL